MDAVTSGLVVSTAATAAGAVNSSHARQHSPSAAAYSAVQTAAHVADGGRPGARGSSAASDRHGAPAGFERLDPRSVTVMKVHAAAWVPGDDPERPWNDAADLAVEWLLREARARGQRPLLAATVPGAVRYWPTSLITRKCTLLPEGRDQEDLAAALAAFAKLNAICCFKGARTDPAGSYVTFGTWPRGMRRRGKVVQPASMPKRSITNSYSEPRRSAPQPPLEARPAIVANRDLPRLLPVIGRRLIGESIAAHRCRDRSSRGLLAVVSTPAES